MDLVVFSRRLRNPYKTHPFSGSYIFLHALNRQTRSTSPSSFLCSLRIWFKHHKWRSRVVLGLAGVEFSSQELMWPHVSEQPWCWLGLNHHNCQCWKVPVSCLQNFFFLKLASGQRMSGCWIKPGFIRHLLFLICCSLALELRQELQLHWAVSLTLKSLWAVLGMSYRKHSSGSCVPGYRAENVLWALAFSSKDISLFPEFLMFGK